MIRYTSGNPLESDAEALVNTVNEVGVMGKGVALMFRETFPESSRAYAEACERGEVQVYDPVQGYQNAPKRQGVLDLTLQPLSLSPRTSAANREH